ncbi:aminotransferase class V-fold PLP-dependent enzyme [Mesonia ostreae]|uniref:Aminotransferase class V-fold PLP-dependent enzyme n=1 Tax=Mesonia ostreae TaxID=861110 RepID=A0ABU2KMA5_9FLAO|nr:aminotransferase class V-fold PLP-dependent enzyme [Mesonia ostreae]MDT0295793.1 aminotransferase class V-fold PLP-dependent enzyme [Mesonia ostreae]
MNNLRKHFPLIEQYTYLNTAATGLLSEPVFDYQQDKNIDFLVQGSLYRDKEANILTEIREKIAHFFSAEASRVALVPNFSFGFNTLLEGFSAGTKFLLLENDYPSINLAVEARDFNLTYAQIDENLEQNILQKVETEKPEVLALSLVQYLNGIKIDLTFIQELKKKYPQLLIIADGTQYLGTEAFKFAASGIDVLGASAYKWINAGFGNGFFMFSEKAAHQISPKTQGSDSYMGKYKENGLHLLGNLEPGHLNYTNMGSIKIALELQEQIGKEDIEKHLQILSAEAKKKFTHLGLLEESVLNRKEHSTIFNLKGGEKLFQRLTQKDIICSQRGDGIRLSFHYYNTLEDLEALVEVLKK